jgi:hypothetical protein
MSEPINSPNAVLTGTLIDTRVKLSLAHWRSHGLSEDEMAEMNGILELNKILSFVNTKLATELWQSATLSDN